MAAKLRLRSQLADAEISLVEARAERNREVSLLRADLSTCECEAEQWKAASQHLELTVRELRRLSTEQQRESAVARLALDDDKRAAAENAVKMRATIAHLTRRAESCEGRLGSAERRARRAEDALAGERAGAQQSEQRVRGGAEERIVLSGEVEELALALDEMRAERDAQHERYVAAAKRNNKLEQRVAEGEDLLASSTSQEQRVARRSTQAEVARHTAVERALRAELATAVQAMDGVRAEERGARAELLAQIGSMAKGESGSEVRVPFMWMSYCCPQYVHERGHVARCASPPLSCASTRPRVRRAHLCPSLARYRYLFAHAERAVARVAATRRGGRGAASVVRRGGRRGGRCSGQGWRRSAHLRAQRA